MTLLNVIFSPFFSISILKFPSKQEKIVLSPNFLFFSFFSLSLHTNRVWMKAYAFDLTFWNSFRWICWIWERLDSNFLWLLQVDVCLSDGAKARAAVPSGASTGSWDYYEYVVYWFALHFSIYCNKSIFGTYFRKMFGSSKKNGVSFFILFRLFFGSRYWILHCVCVDEKNVHILPKR